MYGKSWFRDDRSIPILSTINYGNKQRVVYLPLWFQNGVTVHKGFEKFVVTKEEMGAWGEDTLLRGELCPQDT